ncbi:MAG TPA: PIN domain-containing protein [Oscillatoriaceae cyanobacterium]
MAVLVDTSVWSLALRRRSPQSHPSSETLKRLLEQGEDVVLPGIVLQEILSGIRAPEQYERIRSALSIFPLVAVERDDYEEAAALANRCRAGGVQAGTIDALIATITLRRGLSLLTADADFRAIARFCPLVLMD